MPVLSFNITVNIPQLAGLTTIGEKVMEALDALKTKIQVLTDGQNALGEAVTHLSDVAVSTRSALDQIIATGQGATDAQLQELSTMLDSAVNKAAEIRAGAVSAADAADGDPNTPPVAPVV